MDGFRYQRRGLPQKQAEENRTGSAQAHLARRAGDAGHFADEADAQRTRGRRGEETRRAPQGRRAAESARPEKESDGAPDEQKGQRAPRAQDPPPDHRRALRRDRRGAADRRHPFGRAPGGYQADARPRRRRVLPEHLRQRHPASGQDARRGGGARHPAGAIADFLVQNHPAHAGWPQLGYHRRQPEHAV